MCFGNPKTPEVSPAPSPAPVPTASSEATQVGMEDARRLKLKRLRSGLASTIKTPMLSSTGSPSDSNNVLYNKTKTGQ